MDHGLGIDLFQGIKIRSGRQRGSGDGREDTVDGLSQGKRLLENPGGFCGPTCRGRQTLGCFVFGEQFDRVTPMDEVRIASEEVLRVLPEAVLERIHKIQAQWPSQQLKGLDPEWRVSELMTTRTALGKRHG